MRNIVFYFLYFLSSPIYYYCEGASVRDNDLVFDSRSWCPEDLALQHMAKDLVDRVRERTMEACANFKLSERESLYA